MDSAEIILDRAQAAKEVSIMTALVLIQTGGDPHAAIELLDQLSDIAPPETLQELDVIPIAQQAIREAVVYRQTGQWSDPSADDS